jgi:hypothetical protein
MSASALVADVLQRVKGEPVYLAGSLVAAETYGLTGYHDVDLFCPTPQVFISLGTKLQVAGFKPDERMERAWHRWLRYGFKSWHTNSFKLFDPNGMEWNLVYKLSDGHPTTSLAQVLESFDFGLLGTGYDVESVQFRDLRPYLFPNEYRSKGNTLHPSALPMMPNKRDNWRNGFISQYNGLRECGRYAKYTEYGYDLSLVKDDLSTGYWSAAAYLSTTFDEEKQELGKIYEVIAQHIDLDNIQQLSDAAKKIDYKDSLDLIMEALE